MVSGTEHEHSSYGNEAPQGQGRKAGLVTAEVGPFAAALPERGALVALDLSPRRIGVAVSDPGRILVTPLATFLRRGEARDLEHIARTVRERQAAGLVVGLPVSMDGREGPPARMARAFAEQLAQSLGLPVLLQDERLSTFAVEAALAEGRIARRQRRARHLDHFAAAVILEDALGAIARARAQTPR